MKLAGRAKAQEPDLALFKARSDLIPFGGANRGLNTVFVGGPEFNSFKTRCLQFPYQCLEIPVLQDVVGYRSKEHGPILRELVGPAPQIRSDGISGADCSKQNEVSPFQLTRFKSVSCGEGYGCGCSVAVFGDVDDNAL